MLEILCFILGFFVGGYLIFWNHKGRVEKGFEPYILGDGTLQWRERPTMRAADAASLSSAETPGDSSRRG